MRAVGIVLAGGNSNRLEQLSNKRAVAAMPIAGGYRSIDFALSNMSNSHVQKVAVLPQYNARSLNEHLNSAKWWDFGRKQGGLFVFTPTITAENGNWYRGTADAIAQNLSFLKSSHEPYVIIENIKVTKENITLMSPDKNPTLKIILPNGTSLIKFKSSVEELESLKSPTGCITITVVGRCERNMWNGTVSPQVIVEDYEITNICQYYF